MGLGDHVQAGEAVSEQPKRLSHGTWVRQDGRIGLVIGAGNKSDGPTSVCVNWERDDGMLGPITSETGDGLVPLPVDEERARRRAALVRMGEIR